MDNTFEKYFLTRGKAILFFLIIIVIIIVIVIVKKSGASSLNSYKAFEEEMKNAGQSYYEITDVEIENGMEKIVNLDTLKTMHLVFDNLKDECKGYIVIASEKNISNGKYEISYRPYIKCSDKYMTPNYSEY